MKKQWQVKTLKDTSLPILPELPAIVVRLLALRGLTDPVAISEFLNPEFGKLHDLFLFKQMQTAVDRIKQAVMGKEKVTIYADYDADAITACAVVFLGLKKMGLTADYYIPDRFSEGYGMNAEAVKAIAAGGTKLVITVDCGTNSVAEAALCEELGMDLIITDHHELTGSLPKALALINPKNPHDEYPFPYLTGVGVAFKLIQGLYAQQDTLAGYEKWLLDLVAIGTVADCQDLSGENRILVSFGLKVLPKTRWFGLRALLQKSGAGSRVDTYTLGFLLAPRINAAGRIKHGNLAYELLVSEDQAKANALADELDKLNQHRQMLTDQILSEARSQLEQASDKKVLLTYGADWPRGVVGLVAGKLTEEYNRPVLAVSLSNGVGVGSARSIKSFDIIAALNFSKDHLVKYGGHMQAAGFTLDGKKIEDLHLKLLEYADSVNFALAEPILEADAEVTPQDLTWEVWDYLEKFSPFGIGNPQPKFLAKNLEIMELRTVGNTSQHLKLRVAFGSHQFSAISFGRGFLAKDLSATQKIDGIFELMANEWNGTKELEMKILDLKISTNGQ